MVLVEAIYSMRAYDVFTIGKTSCVIYLWIDHILVKRGLFTRSV